MVDLITQLTNLVSMHVGDDHFKKMYAISLLSMGINNVEEPIHIHVFGDPESGKTDLQTRFLGIIPDGHKDIASDFTPRVLMYANLNPGTIISINDKIFTDPMCTLLNQVCDSTAWRMGRVVAVTVGKERVNLIFPPRTLFWMNSNKAISDYAIHEVDPIAVESRFMVFNKKYTQEQKKNIFINRSKPQELNENDIETLKNTLKEMFKTPKTITCSDEMRGIIWNKSNKRGDNSIRSIGRNLTICQVYALVANRTEVNIEDISNAFELLKEQFFIKVNTSETSDRKLIDIIKKELILQNQYNALAQDKRKMYSCKEIQIRLKGENIKMTLNLMKEEGNIGSETFLVGVGSNRIPTEHYFILEKI